MLLPTCLHGACSETVFILAKGTSQGTPIATSARSYAGAGHTAIPEVCSAGTWSNSYLANRESKLLLVHTDHCLIQQTGWLGGNAAGPLQTLRPRATAQHGPLPHTDPDLHFRLARSCVLFQIPPDAAPVAVRPMAGCNLVAHSPAPASSILRVQSPMTFKHVLDLVPTFIISYFAVKTTNPNAQPL